MTVDHRSTIALFLLAFSGFATGQDSSLQIRAVLNDPGKRAEFYVGTPGEGMTELRLSPEGLAEPQKVSTVDGVLNLFDSDQVTKEDAKAHLAATMKLPAGSTSVILIIFPAVDQKPPYRIVAVPDDTKAFPWGSNKVVNLTPVEFAVQLGELKMQLPGGKVTDIPKVTKLDPSNRAQTNFYYKQGDQWVLATERRLQYVDALRRVFVISKQPKALAPDVRTIQDQRLMEVGGEP